MAKVPEQGQVVVAEVGHREQGRPGERVVGLAGDRVPGRGIVVGPEPGEGTHRRRLPAEVVALLPDPAERRHGLGGVDGAERGDGQFEEAGVGQVLDRVGVTGLEAVAAEEGGEGELLGRVGLLLEVGPEGAGGLVGVDREEGVDGRPAGLRLAGVQQGGQDRDEPRVGRRPAGVGEGPRAPPG